MLDRNSAALALTFPSDREIVMTRVFDAPRQLVFEAWTKPEHLVHWFGARGWSLTICEIELRPGGTYRFVWRGPEGEEMGMGGVYREILPPERLVSTESFVGCVPGKESVNTMILEERNGKTTMTTTIVYPSAEVRDAVIQSGMERGVGESMDRLAEHLQTMA